jgi:ABC-type multidrug transport system fused ATPase/permease subunit
MADIPFSKKYLHDLKRLHIEHEEKRIMDEEFSQRVDELRDKEAQTNEALARLLLLQKLEEAEKEVEIEVKTEFQLKKQALIAKDREQQAEQDRQRQKELREQLEKEEESRRENIKKENDRIKYRKEIDNYINQLEDNAKKWQNWYIRLQILLLFFSALTATVASIDGIPRWMVSSSGFIATIAGGLLTTFKMQDRIYANRKAIAEVKLECQKYDNHIEEYNSTNITDEEAFVKFSRNLISIQGQEMLQEVELWNPKKDDKPTREEETQRSLPPKAEAKDNSEKQKLAEDPQGSEIE